MRVLIDRVDTMWKLDCAFHFRFALYPAGIKVNRWNKKLLALIIVLDFGCERSFLIKTDRSASSTLNRPILYPILFVVVGEITGFFNRREDLRMRSAFSPHHAPAVQ